MRWTQALAVIFSLPFISGCVASTGGVFRGVGSQFWFNESYITDSVTECAVHNPNPMPNETISWSGPCKDGKGHGRGRLKWLIDGKLYDEYVGDLVDGKYHGHGKAKYADGSVYEGEWKDGKPHGKGVAVWRHQGNCDGKCMKKYSGEWKDGKLDGYGVAEWSDGDYYEGYWSDDAREGNTVFEIRREKERRRWLEAKLANLSLGDYICVWFGDGNGGFCGTVEQISKENIQLEIVRVEIGGTRLYGGECTSGKVISNSSIGRRVWTKKYCVSEW